MVNYAPPPPPHFKEVWMAYCFGIVSLSIHPSIYQAFKTSHIFGTMYVRIFKFHKCITYVKLASWWTWLGPFSDILAIGKLVSKIPKEALELGLCKQFRINLLMTWLKLVTFYKYLIKLCHHFRLMYFSIGKSCKQNISRIPRARFVNQANRDHCVDDLINFVRVMSLSSVGILHGQAYSCGQSVLQTHFLFDIMKTRLFKYIENFTSKNWKFSDKKTQIFFCWKHRLWVLVRTASVRWF